MHLLGWACESGDAGDVLGALTLSAFMAAKHVDTHSGGRILGLLKRARGRSGS